MFQKIEMRLSGSGGQGVILASIILANAAIEDGLNAVQTQSYGPEARGGLTKSEIIISRDEIKYPKVVDCNILLVLTQKSYDKYRECLDENSILLADDSININEDAEYEIYRAPIIETAKNKIGNHMTISTVSLGALYALIGEELINIDSIKKSIREKVPKATVDKNINAFEEGIKLIRG